MAIGPRFTVRHWSVRSHFGSSRDPSPRLEFPLHLPSRQPPSRLFESGFCLLCTSHGPCCLSPYHQVWEIRLYRILSALCGGIWIQSWEEASYVQSLWEDFSAAERHIGRFLTRQEWQEKGKQQSERLSGHVSTQPKHVTPAMSRRSSVVSWSDSPRDQAVPKSEDAVMEDCTESHQAEINKKIKANDKLRKTLTLGEQPRNQVGTTAPAAMGPCAPSEPVLHPSSFAVTSENAVTSSCFVNRVDCAAPHGFDTFPAHLAWSQPLVGTQSAHVGHLGNEPMSVISGFYAESSAVVQGKSCVVRLSQGSDTDRSGGSCGKHTSPARLARSQTDMGTQHANVGYTGVDFSMVSKSEILSSGLHAVEVVDPDSHAESPAVV